MLIDKINMYDPPAALGPRQELLDHARNTVIAMLAEFASDGLRVDEHVAVVLDPEIAAKTGKPVLTVAPREALLTRMPPNRERVLLAAPVPDGWMKVAVFSGRSSVFLNMNVGAPPTSAVELQT